MKLWIVPWCEPFIMQHEVMPGYRRLFYLYRMWLIAGSSCSARRKESSGMSRHPTSGLYVWIGSLHNNRLRSTNGARQKRTISIIILFHPKTLHMAACQWLTETLRVRRSAYPLGGNTAKPKERSAQYAEALRRSSRSAGDLTWPDLTLISLPSLLTSSPLFTALYSLHVLYGKIMGTGRKWNETWEDKNEMKWNKWTLIILYFRMRGEEVKNDHRAEW